MANRELSDDLLTDIQSLHIEAQGELIDKVQSQRAEEYIEVRRRYIEELEDRNLIDIEERVVLSGTMSGGNTVDLIAPFMADYCLEYPDDPYCQKYRGE
ncbi:hypothetical protein [Salinigranum sp. GCM10025319]|uniref:hypothetical protein n=1 Tax=Salinigranum sp. GCM10025319 TaxID=3252687 RepID=UPI003605E813